MNLLPRIAPVAGLAAYVVLSWWLIRTVGHAAFYAYIVMFSLIGLVWFALAMKLKAAHEDGRLPRWLFPFAWLFVAVGVLYDVVVLNWLVKPVLFLDWPREYTLTAYLQGVLRKRPLRTRLDRYRVRLAKAICKQLDRFDPGHCR